MPVCIPESGSRIATRAIGVKNRDFEIQVSVLIPYSATEINQYSCNCLI